MSNETLKRLGMVLGAIVLVWAILALWQRTGRDTTGHFALATVDTAHVNTIVVRHAGDTVRLVRAARGWTVNGFAADTSAVTPFLGALGDTSARGELVSENVASQASLGTDSANAHRLEVKVGQKTVATYLVGNRDAGYEGVYLRMPGRTRRTTCRSITAST